MAVQTTITEQPSKGHIAWLIPGDPSHPKREVYQTEAGDLYLASIDNVIDCTTGYRIGRWESTPMQAGQRLDILRAAYTKFGGQVIEPVTDPGCDNCGADTGDGCPICALPGNWCGACVDKHVALAHTAPEPSADCVEILANGQPTGVIVSKADMQAAHAFLMAQTRTCTYCSFVDPQHAPGCRNAGRPHPLCAQCGEYNSHADTCPAVPAQTTSATHSHHCTRGNHEWSHDYDHCRKGDYYTCAACLAAPTPPDLSYHATFARALAVETPTYTPEPEQRDTHTIATRYYASPDPHAPGNALVSMTVLLYDKQTHECVAACRHESSGFLSWSGNAEPVTLGAMMTAGEALALWCPCNVCADKRADNEAAAPPELAPGIPVPCGCVPGGAQCLEAEQLLRGAIHARGDYARKQGIAAFKAHQGR